MTKGTPIDWLSNQAARAVIGAVRLLPYAKRVPFMGAVMRKWLGGVLGFRKRAETNLALIYPEMPPSERRRIADGVLDNFGRTLIENYSHPDFAAHLADTNLTGAGVDALAQATAEKRPVLFVTAHFGNHEAPRHILTRMGHSVGGLYRPFTNPYFDADYRRTIGALGGSVFAQGRRGTIGLIRYLREANQGVLFYDVFYGAGEKLEFLGKPAMTALSAAEIAIKVDAVLIPYYGVRNPDGMTFTAILDAPIAISDPVTMTNEMNARLEAQIAAHPEQWFWVHRRWKMRKA
jgi:Kdo2-lipid IVA lauroyltransferase/acyltransferase